MVSPFSHPLSVLIPSETQWNRKIRVFIHNMPNTVSFLYLIHWHSKWYYQVLASPSSKT